MLRRSRASTAGSKIAIDRHHDEPHERGEHQQHGDVGVLEVTLDQILVQVRGDRPQDRAARVRRRASSWRFLNGAPSARCAPADQLPHPRRRQRQRARLDAERDWRTALAITPPTGMMPPSPAPLAPSGLCGAGFSSSAMRADHREIARGRQQIIGERAGQELAVARRRRDFPGARRRAPARWRRRSGRAASAD